MTAELEHWHDFYVLVGTAGATLLALLFVAVSLGAGFLNEAQAAATRTFYSPVIIHFSQRVLHFGDRSGAGASQHLFRRADRRLRGDRFLGLALT